MGMAQNARLQQQLNQWAELGSGTELLENAVASSSDVELCAGALSWLSSQALGAVYCLPVGICAPPDAWEAARVARVAARNDTKWAQALRSQLGLQLTIRASVRKLGEELRRAYEEKLGVAGECTNYLFRSVCARLCSLARAHCGWLLLRRPVVNQAEASRVGR